MPWGTDIWGNEVWAFDEAGEGFQTEDAPTEGILIEDLPLVSSFITATFDCRHTDQIGMRVWTEGPATAAGSLYIAMGNLEGEHQAPVRLGRPIATVVDGVLLNEYVSVSLLCAFIRLEFDRTAGHLADLIGVSFKLKRKHRPAMPRETKRPRKIEQRWWLGAWGRWGWERGGSKRR